MKRHLIGLALMLIVLLSLQVSAGDILARWKLDEPSGSVCKDEYDAWNGTITGASLNHPGMLNESYYFDSSTDKVVIGDMSSLGGKTNYTITLWFNFTTLPTSSYCQLASKNNGDGNPTIELKLIKSSSTMYNRFFARSAGVDLVLDGRTSVPMQMNNWTLVVWRLENKTLTGQIGDLSLSSTDAGFTVLDDSSYPLQFGYSNDGVEACVGYYDDIRIYNYSLSNAEIEEIQNRTDALSNPTTTSTSTTTTTTSTSTATTTTVETTTSTDLPTTTTSTTSATSTTSGRCYDSGNVQDEQIVDQLIDVAGCKGVQMKGDGDRLTRALLGGLFFLGLAVIGAAALILVLRRKK